MLVKGYHADGTPSWASEVVEIVSVHDAYTGFHDDFDGYAVRLEKSDGTHGGDEVILTRDYLDRHYPDWECYLKEEDEE